MTEREDKARYSTLTAKPQVHHTFPALQRVESDVSASCAVRSSNMAAI